MPVYDNFNLIIYLIKLSLYLYKYLPTSLELFPIYLTFSQLN